KRKLLRRRSLRLSDKINMKNLKGFTLIELLVVISIIWLLASTVLISLSGARESARIATLKEFSASIYHSLGDNLVAYWKFDGDLKDSSGNNNIVTIGGGKPETYATDSISGKSFVGLGSISLNNYSKNIKFPSGSFTAEGWIKISNPSYIGVFLIGGFSIYLQYIDDLWSAIVFGTSCSILGEEGSKVLSGKWNHIVLSYRGSGSPNKMAIFLNGKQILSTTCEGGNLSLPTDDSNSSPISATSMDDGSNIYADDFRLYDAPLTMSQIEQHYAEGLYKIQLADLTNNLLLK
ncbi:MAG: prepilin-type N-terminal cleavage/methylation domain-containing protein, partial [Candidatus Nealsonbacteria bacterium]|nr:prepilin-type N-terminal cleavage/methylation domain-containing protein [Candidatus Nealsonbacteria bacterium]